MAPAALRIIDWFSRPGVGATSHAVAPHDGKEDAGSRARLAARLALASLSSEPVSAANEAAATELFREASYWAACALSSDAPASGEAHAEAVWDNLDDATLRDASDEPGRAEALRRHMKAGSRVHFEALDAAERSKVRGEARALAKLLLKRLSAREDPGRVLRRRWVARATWLALALLSAISLRAFLQARHDARLDLAAGRPWHASSPYPGGCKSPAQDCEENTGFFFHTSGDDASPFVEIDLGEVRRFSTVVVTNRLDCCQERAVPLFVEVEDANGAWREIARRSDPFSTWRATFDPVEARHVRMQLRKPGPLHLYRVRILP